MSLKLTFKININGIIATALLFLLVVPEGLYNLTPRLYNFVYTYCQALSFLIISVWWIIKVKNTKKRNEVYYYLTVILFCLYLLGRTIMQGGDLLYTYTIVSPCFASFALVYIYKNKLKTLIHSLLLVLEFWIYLNLIFMIVYPEGMYYVFASNSKLAWLFGYKSSFQYFIFPALGLGWLNKSYGGNKFRTTVLFVTCFLETLLSKNVMLLIGVVIFFMLLILHFADRKFATMRNYLIGIICANVLFIFFTSALVNTSVMSFLLNVFGKGTDLSYRTIIWPATINYIKEHLILGWGVLSSNVRASMYGLHDVAHAHNQLLEIFFWGGIVLMLIFARILLYINKKAMKYRELASTKVLTTTIFLIFIMVIVEVFTRRIGGPMWMIIFLAYYCDRIDMSYHKKQIV